MDLTDTLLAMRSLVRRKIKPELLPCVERLQAVVLEIRETSSQASRDIDSPKELNLIKGSLNELRKLVSDDTQWECRATALLIVTEFLSRINESTEDIHSLIISDLLSISMESAEKSITDSGSRIQICTVKLMEQLARLDGYAAWKRFGPLLCDMIDESFKQISSPHVFNSCTSILDKATDSPSKVERIAIPTTVEWKTLETRMSCLTALINGRGASFVASGNVYWCDGYILNIVIEQATVHENRFVREEGYRICQSIAASACAHFKGMHSEIIDKIVPAISHGLQDNWSQVRYAASGAARSLMVGLEPSEREHYMADLVPRMCLNRYYLAEGVRNYSQETWGMIFKGQIGIEAVCKHIASMVAYYCSQAKADNHGVREAACHSIAELSTKIPGTYLSSYVDTLIEALLGCFKDESWPVRNAACISTGRFVVHYPKESEKFIEELFDLWLDHLSDNIWSVREDAAVALGNAVKAYPEHGLEKVMTVLPEFLERFDIPDIGATTGSSYDEEESTRSVKPSSRADSNPQRRRIFEGKLSDLHSAGLTGDSLHTDQQLYSCGSLAPKLRRRAVGCMDHGHIRNKKNWEFTDGAIYLVRELALQKPEIVAPFLPTLGEIANKSAHIPELQVTLWKQLNIIAKALGKRMFKKNLELFLPAMTRALKNENHLASTAAADFIAFLQIWLGQIFFKGTVSALPDGERLWAALEASSLIDV